MPLHRMTPKKPRLGQHFLVSPAARQRVVEALGELEGRTVVEIGPGSGALTDLLASRAGHLIAVELDRVLAAHLRAKWDASHQVQILEANILDVDLSSLQPAPDEKLVIVGNLPYYLTSDILLHLFARVESIERAVVMVQEEVAERLAAHPGVRAYGVLSATAQMHASVEKLFTLTPEDFDPPPKVHSAVVRFKMRSRFADLGVDRAEFLRFLQACFNQKRKTLLNNLKAAGIAGPARAEAALEHAELDPRIRAESVPLEIMAQLYRSL